MHTPRPSGIEFGGSMSRSSKLAGGFNLVRPFAKSKQNRCRLGVSVPNLRNAQIEPAMTLVTFLECWPKTTEAARGKTWNTRQKW